MGMAGNIMRRTKLTEVEGCVLALISVEGPTTPYAIRKVFLNSPSPQWSGSAGTIYPLIRRLSRQGLIRSTLALTGKRAGYQVSLTRSGSRALRVWLSVPLPEWVVGVPPDPLRTRIRFLAAIDGERQRAFLIDAERRTRKHLEIVAADCARQQAKGGLPYLVARGALLSMRARCAFLKEVATVLGFHLKKEVMRGR